jgi:hypothetical protein
MLPRGEVGRVLFGEAAVYDPGVQGDLEVRPLATCRECGARVARPVGPSYVYGVGAIGFQHCAVCGARWRCAWPVAQPPRRLSVRAAALAGAAVLALTAGVVAYATTHGRSGPELASARHGAAASGAPSLHAARERYLGIVGPVNAARAELRRFLDSAPPITPVDELSRRVTAFAAVSRRGDAELVTTRWPEAAQQAVQALVAANRAVAADLETGVGLLNQPGFADRVGADAATLDSAADRVRTALGLPVARDVPDRRFPSM